LSRQRALVVLAALSLLGCSCASACQSAIRVMTFNTWGAGANHGQGSEPIIEAIRAAGADVVTLQEVRAESADCNTEHCPAEGPSQAQTIADELGFHVYEPPLDSMLNWASATLSRYPIVAIKPGSTGVVLDVDGSKLAVFNIHLNDYPYQPYQALGIPYGNAEFLSDAASLAQAAVLARGDAIQQLETELDAAEDAWAAIVAGDFNEPSHRDWTAAAAEAGRHPLAVQFPSVQALERLGFIDAYRVAHPDELSHPGFTWTPTAAEGDPAEHHDRIDFILVRGDDPEVGGAWVVGEAPQTADIVVQPWISDHRAVVVELRFGTSEGLTLCSEYPGRSP